MGLLDKINSPEDLKRLIPEMLPTVAQGLRDKMVETVSKTGGHLASSLGAVDLTVALHYVFDSPKDKIILPDRIFPIRINRISFQRGLPVNGVFMVEQRVAQQRSAH